MRTANLSAQSRAELLAGISIRAAGTLSRKGQTGKDQTGEMLHLGMF